MTNFLIPHPESTISEMEEAVIAWRKAAAHERFRIEHNLCYGCTKTAFHNAELYEQTARQIEQEIEAKKNT